MLVCGQELAETDGNRTRLAEILGYYGFEDRAHHQMRNASMCLSLNVETTARYDHNASSPRSCSSAVDEGDGNREVD